MRQISFWKKPSTAHGGRKVRGKRKTARPIATKECMHVIMHSDRARGQWALDKHRKEIEALIAKTAERFGIKVRGRQVLWNHIHLLIQGRKRREIQGFLRVLPALITMLVTGAGNTRPMGRFWGGLVFSRIVKWDRDYLGMLRYIAKNALQAAGIPRGDVDKWFKEAFG